MSPLRCEDAEVMHVPVITFLNGIGRWEQVCSCVRIMDDTFTYH